MLGKYGYIEDESMTKKVRVRDWHIKKITTDDSDNSSNWFYFFDYSFITKLNLQ